MAIWYVRNSGGTTTQCTGQTNADYDGAGSGDPCAYSNLQDAIAAATWGDTIKLHAGQTFSTSVGFQLTNKGTPPTGTDADFITITTDDTSGTPAALSGYPASETRITTAMAANMPTVRTTSSTTVFYTAAAAKYWKIERLNITNQDTGVNCTALISSETASAGSVANYPDHITFQLNWIHPIEETGTALQTSQTVRAAPTDNVWRTAQNAFYFEGTNVIVRQNAVQGFVGLTKYGSEVGQRMTTSCYLASSYSDTVLIENNLLEAWTYALFLGGSVMPAWLVTEGSTVVSCTGNPCTSCTFNSVAGLTVGDPVAVYVSNSTSGNKWGAGFVQSIAGGLVTFTAPLCQSFDGNTCEDQNGTPQSGDECRWNGYSINNVTIKRNVFAHYPEWVNLTDQNQTSYTAEASGKGYFEVKAATNVLIDGNVFFGTTGATITTRNQGADYVWASLDGLTISNNYFKTGNNNFVAAVTDTAAPTRPSTDISFTNNLIVGLVTDDHFQNEVQSILVDATAGTYTLTWDGQTTGNIAFDATPAQVKTALEGLSNINVDDVLVRYNPGYEPQMLAEWCSFGQYAQTNVAQMTADATNLTGGTHTVTINTEYQGTAAGQYQPGMTLSGNFTGGNNISITHNTVLASKTADTALGSPPYNNYRAFTSVVPVPMTGLIIKDNFFGASTNICFTDLAGSSTTGITNCWPSAVVTNNVFANLDSWGATELNASWFTPYPSNTLITDWSSAGFTSAPAKLDSTGNYKLLPSSSYYAGNADDASDGTDVGVNYTALIAALGFDPNTGEPAPGPVTVRANFKMRVV